MFRRLGRVKISFQSNDKKKKKKKKNDIKKAELKEKKKVRTMKICKTCKNSQGLQKKEEGILQNISYIYHLWVTVITPDICQILQEKPNGKLKYNTIQYNTIQYNTIQYNTIQYNTILYSTIQHKTISAFIKRLFRRMQSANNTETQINKYKN